MRALLHINIIMRFAVTPIDQVAMRKMLYIASLPSRGVTSQAIKYANEFSPDHVVLQYKTRGSLVTWFQKQNKFILGNITIVRYIA